MDETGASARRRWTGAALAALLCCAAPAPASAIVRGERIAAAAAPWAVSLQHANGQGGARGSGHFCSGTAIGPRRVLTARHCTEDLGLHTSRVMTGSADPAGAPGRSVAVARAWVPGVIPDDDAWPLREPGDVAVLETAEDLGVPALPLSQAGLELPAGEPVSAYGFGRASLVDSPQAEPALLRRASMRLYSEAECDESEVAGQPWYLCAGPAADAAGGLVAPGDSGGGLVRQGPAGPEVVGVNATGTAGPLRDQVSGFASVAVLSGFIAHPERGIELPRPRSVPRVEGSARVGRRLRCAVAWSSRPQRVEVAWYASRGRTVTRRASGAAGLVVPPALRGTRIACAATGWVGDTNGALSATSARTAVVR